MPSPIAGETSVDERERAVLLGASRKKRKRKRAADECNNSNASLCGSGDDNCSSGGEMSPEEDSTASPPAGLIAGRDEGQQRLTSPPSGSKFVHEMSRSGSGTQSSSGNVGGGEDDFGETCLEESTIIKNRSEDDDEEEASSDEDNGSERDENENGKEKSGARHHDVSGMVDESSTSDVENFDGKIVYNPDGSAYIIENSELSDDDAAELPQLIGNGCIVDGRGVNVSRSEGFPQIANAIYVSSRSTNHSMYGNLSNYTKAGLGGVPDKSVVPEVPVMHSYRVYSVRDNKYSERNNNSAAADKNSQDVENLSSKDCSSVPVKPILMCFICKLSFGYAKSFVAHAMSDHNVLLQDDEKDILSHKNTSAIIQCVGKEKEPLVSFLEPLSPPVMAPQNAVSATSTTLDGKYRQVASGVTFDGKYRGGGTTTPPSSVGQHHMASGASVYSSYGIGGVPTSMSGGVGVIESSQQQKVPNCVMDLTRKSPISGGSSAVTTTSSTTSSNNNSNNGGQNNNGAVTSPGASPSPGSTVSPLLSASSMSFAQHPPNFLTGTTIGVCPDHMGGRPSGVDCSKCELILSSSRLGGVGGGPLAGMHSRNSCKTLKCPKCNWHYKYQETLEIHMKEKHPETETSCIYCIAGQPHPRLARGETYTCGYKPYRCEVCNYSTTTKGNLSIHMQSDKHLNNMQELQNGTVSNSELAGAGHQQSPAPGTGPAVPSGHGKPTGMTSPSAGGSGIPYHSPMTGSPATQQKPKPTFRCDVCNYETNVARNLRIHMTSEKHTHNMMVLQQNMKQMQALSAIQQPSQHQQQLNFEQLLHFHPGLTLPGEKPPPHSEAALADMAYNQALLIQLMTGGQLPPHMSPDMAPNLDMGLNPETMEPPPEPADLNPDNLYQCCVCNVFTSDSLEALSHHLAADRTKIREQEILAIVAGHYVCKLCTYKTTLKANFQLHCKTDKHLQRLQHVNHVKEGGLRNEWKLKYVSSPGGVQVRCNACDYYTNSTHKLQLHAAAQRHEFSASLFRHLRDNYDDTAGGKIYQCVLCEFSCADKLPLFQHVRSMQHLKIEQIHQLHRRSSGKDVQMDLSDMFKVIPHSDSSGSEQALDFCNQSQCSNTPKPNNVQTPPSHRFSPASSASSSAGSKDMETKGTQSDSSKVDDDQEDAANETFEDGIRCTTCNKMFRNSEELCLHQNENGHFDIKQIEGSVFLCPKKECSAYFTTVLNVQRHYLDVHIQQNRINTVAVSEKHVYKYRCSQCSLAFKTMEKLQLHSQYHFIRDATKCVLCGRSFRSIISLQKHVETSHADLSEEEMLIFKQSLLSNPLLLAGLSGQALDPSITELLKKESLRMDTDESMDEDSPNKESEDQMNVAGTAENSDDDDETCKEQFIEDYMNSQAIAEKNYNDPNRKYKCHKCKMAFTRQSYLTLHNKKVPHRKGEKVIYPMEKYLDPNRPYKCEVCKESFTQKNILLVHYNSVSHLHKLKRASQDLQQSNSSVATTVGNATGATNLMVSPTSHYSMMAGDDSFVKLQQQQAAKLKNNQDLQQAGLATSTATVANANLLVSPTSHYTMMTGDESFMKLPQQSKLKRTAQDMQRSGQVSATSAAGNLLVSPTSHYTMMTGDESFMELPQQAKKSSHMYKHLLESFGFDLVMQFNENHQRRQRKEREENERLLAELQSAQMLEESAAPETRKDSVTDSVKEEKDEAVATAQTDELPEVSKSTCTHCNKEFSSVWVLKAHCEEVHKDLVPLDFLEKYAQQIKCEIEKKVIPVTMNATAMVPTTTTADVGTDTYSCARDEDMSSDHEASALNLSTNAVTDSSTLTYDDNSERESDDRDATQKGSGNESSATNPINDSSTLTYDDNTSEKDCDERDATMKSSQSANEPNATPNPPTTCSTPASSTDSVSPHGANGNPSGNPSPNIPMSLAQQMNEMQAALNAMAASQLQQQLQQFNPMMMGMASLGMGLPLGLNMPALAAMNLQPPLVPMMMPPPSFDPIVGLGQAQNPLFSQQAANLDTTSILAKQQQHLMQQQQVANASQQKRARTRITDDQLKILRAHFDINNSPSEEQINKMAAESGLPPKVIKHWFRNTLFKERQRNKDSPYNFNNPPSTTLNLEEYEKTGEAKVLPLSSSAGSGDESGSILAAAAAGLHSASSVQNNNIDSSSKLNAVAQPPVTARKTSTPTGGTSVTATTTANKCNEMNFLPNHLQQSFSAPRSIASSPVLIKTEPKDGSEAGDVHHAKGNMLEADNGAGHVKKEEYDDVKPNMNYMHDTQAHSPASPNMSESPSSAPSPCSSPLNLTVSSVFNAQHMSNEMTAATNSMLNAAMHQTSNMLPPKLNQNFSTSTPSLSNTNFGAMPNRSVSPGRSNSVDCFTHGVLSSGNSNGSNSSGGSSGKRANRTRFTDYQIKVLQEFFENNAYPKDDDLEYLSKLLSLSPRVIVVWFQNARQKARKVYENQPPVEPVSGIDENTGRFQRTPGLNYQCKKCLLVFQRYYELIRHQKTHCFKEEDAKRSAQAQAAAAQMAAVLSSEDSNSSTIIEQNQQCSVTNSNPSTPAAPVTPTPSASAYPTSPVSHNPSTPESKENTLQCENCNLVFPRFELWREHQLIHIMNPNLFPNYPPESPFGILQQQAQQQQQSQQSQTPQPSETTFANATNTMAAQPPTAAGSDMNANSNPPSPHPLLAMYNTNKRKYEEYVYLSDRDSDQPKDKRLRTTILPEQLDYLYQKYQIESNPSRKMLENIANEVGLKKRVVQVWFQNTRARERKGQFRAHSQVINKRCPFCPALFKVKTALESHLTTKHADQCSRGEINIDALPDEEVSHDSTSFVSQRTAANDQANAKYANFNQAANTMLHPLFVASLQGANAENETQMKKYYEDALRRYLTEIQTQQQHEDEYSGSECSENMEDESPPASPASSRRMWSADGKAARQHDEEWSSDDERAIKEKILKAQQSTLQSIMEAIGDGSGMSSSTDSTVVVNKGELNGQQVPSACAHREVDIGHICKRCKLVFPSEPALRAHQSKTGCCGMLRIKQYVYGCKMCSEDYQFNSIQDMQRHLEMKHPRCASPLADEMENVVNQITALAAAKAAAANSEDSNGNLFCQPGDVAKKSKLFAAAVAQNAADGQDSNGNLFCSPADVAKKSKLFAVPNRIAATPTGGH